MLNQEDKIKHLKDLSKHPGWIVLCEIVEDKLAGKRKLLETCPEYVLNGYQGYIKGLKFGLEVVDKALKGDKQNV